MVTLDELKDKLADKARLIGLDLGSKRIGVAICDDERKIATPFKTIEYRNMNYLLSELKVIIKENDIFAIIVGFIIIGGIKSIGKVTERLVPFMGLVYVVSCLLIILSNFEQIPDALFKVFQSAFSFDATTGGVLGSMIAGVKRAVFSNESGIGSAPIAYAPAKSDNHLNTGLMSLLSPVVDTVIVCSMTAMTIIITGVYQDNNGIQGVELTSRGFESYFSWFPSILAVAITLFAISTLITWSYYGLRCWTYIFGLSSVSKYSFKLIFLSFTIIGSSMNLGSVINFSDSMIFAMSLPNIIGLYFLSSGIKDDLKKIKL